jgi:hypothetical protein
MRITALRNLLLICCSLGLLTSCQKELSFDDPVNPGGGTGNPGGGGNPNTTSILGDYDFMGLRANTYAAVSITLLGETVKAVTTSDYTSQNNTGTVKITASSFVYNAVGYEIHSMANMKSYTNGVMDFEQDFPFDFISPPTTDTYPYTPITSDSLTISGPIGVPNPSGGTPTGPVGIKTSWSGDTLLIRTRHSFSQNVIQGGLPAVMNVSVDGITKLKKK